jgi:hypothetical protein
MRAYRRLSQLKSKLREINGTLWVTQAVADELTPRSPYLGLADHLLSLDHNGSHDGSPAGDHEGPLTPEEWEAEFRVDASMGKVMHEISLVKIKFQAHGSHRAVHSRYVYYRQMRLFREINSPG